jgi:hypothetical protein
LEVLDIGVEEMQAGLKTPAPSHSFAAVMKSNEAEKRRELAEETRAAMIEKNQLKNLREFMKKRKSLATNNPSASVINPSPKKAHKSK